MPIFKQCLKGGGVEEIIDQVLGNITMKYIVKGIKNEK
ncbi:hypothetical protein CLK_1850 [Clostridium botulinum A3 str. Loch Maree]|nr:hypothetical protein CLK_1850 [Clostridium botulinum A3 str. Loch Maree]